MSDKKVWFITGCSTGFGNILAKLVLEKGDYVCATARKEDSLSLLKNHYKDQIVTASVDVTSDIAIERAIESTIGTFGRIDVLVNNAGYGNLGAFEEISENHLREVFETNFFGLCKVTRLVLPHMRKNKSGTIFNLSSLAGVVASPGFSAYNASKFAVEGHSEALAQEVKPLGINVVIIQPGPFRTDFAGRSLKQYETMPEYKEALAATRERIGQADGKQPGDPIAACELMFDLSRMENPPTNIVLGQVAYDRIKQKLERVLSGMEEWKDRSLGTDYNYKK